MAFGDKGYHADFSSCWFSRLMIRYPGALSNHHPGCCYSFVIAECCVMEASGWQCAAMWVKIESYWVGQMHADSLLFDCWEENIIRICNNLQPTLQHPTLWLPMNYGQCSNSVLAADATYLRESMSCYFRHRTPSFDYSFHLKLPVDNFCIQPCFIKR